MPSKNRWFKLLGLSTLVGVAATGVLAARQPRPERELEKWQIPERLHRRHAQARQRMEDAQAGTWGSE